MTLSNVSDFIKDKIEYVIIKTMLNDLNFALKVFAIVADGSVFSLSAAQKIYKFIRSYYSQYQQIPSGTILTKLNRIQDINEFMGEVDRLPVIENRDFIIDNTIIYLKKMIYKKAILDAVQLIDDPDRYGEAEDKIRKAMEVSFDMYLGMSYRDELDNRIQFARSYNADGIRSSIEPLDDSLKIGRGFLPKNLYVVSSESNLGKSIVLCNLAANSLLQQKKVLFISLEMQEFFIGQRIDAIATRLNINEIYDSDNFIELKEKFGAVTACAGSGNILIKEYPPGAVNVHHIRALINDLKLYKGFIPDIIIVDYLNLMTAARQSDNDYIKLKHISEELRALSYEFNAPIVTASQLNREAYGAASPDLRTMGESMGIVHTADMIAILSQSPEERQMGLMQWRIVKNRLGPKDICFPTSIDYSNLKISSMVINI